MNSDVILMVFLGAMSLLELAFIMWQRIALNQERYKNFTLKRGIIDAQLHLLNNQAEPAMRALLETTRGRHVGVAELEDAPALGAGADKGAGGSNPLADTDESAFHYERQEGENEELGDSGAVRRVESSEQ